MELQKEDERRYPIHPEHLPRIPETLRRQLVFEEGYGAAFGIADSEIAAQTGGIATRHELLADIGTVIINKPVLADLQELREGGTLWGYVHCVQQRDITQAALDRKQTLIAFEDMFVWSLADILAATHSIKTMKWLAIAQSSMPCNLKVSMGIMVINAKQLFSVLVLSAVVQYTLSKRMVLEISPSAFNAPTTRCVKRCSIVNMSGFSQVKKVRLE